MADSDNLKLRRNLTALIEFSRIINSSLDLDFILNNILLTCMGKFLATKGIVAINKNGKLDIKVSKGITKEIIEQFPVIETGDSLDSNNIFIKFMLDSNLQTFERIKSSDECLGIICLGEKLNKTPYTDDDKEFLKQF